MNAKPMFAEKIHFELANKKGHTIEEGDAQIEIQQENLSLLHAQGDAFMIDLRDISFIKPGDHRISIRFHGGETLVLSRMGHRGDDVYREITFQRNEVILKDLLMGETLQAGGIQAEVTFRSGTSGQVIKSPCEVRVYKTALVFLPQSADVTRIPFSFIQSVEEENFTLRIAMETGGEIVFSKVGRHLDHLKNSLSEAMNDILLNTQDTLRELMPFLPSLEIRNTSRLLRDGRAARKDQLTDLSPGLWDELEKNIAEFGMKDYYDFLKNLSSTPDHVYTGLKKGLMGGLTGLYLWFMLPVYHEDPSKPGNAIGLEASTSDGAGRATYFFRIIPRAEYRQKPNHERMEKVSVQVAEFINRALITINFRREPIYISDEQLQEARFKQYRHSINRIPELLDLRRRFIGRVMHYSMDQWQQDVLALLQFNVDSTDDEANWAKGFEIIEAKKSN